MILFYFLLSLFSETADQCMQCAWPYYGGVNQRGQCVIGVGLQSDLQNTCWNYCLLNTSDYISDVPYVASSDNSGVCVCQYHDVSKPSSSIVYFNRPKKTCTNVGPSDEEINTVYNNTGQASRNANSLSSYSYQISNQSPLNMGDYSSSGSMYIYMSGSNGNGTVSLDLTTPLTNLARSIDYPESQRFRDLGIAVQNVVGEISTGNWFLAQQIGNLDTNFLNLSAQIDQLPGYDLEDDIGALIQTSQDTLRRLINARVGTPASSGTDLSGIYTALSQARDANLAATGAVGDSVHSLAARVAASLTAVQTSVDAVGDSVSSLGGKLNGIGRVIDSGANARWMQDNYSRDSGYLADSARGNWFRDSVRRAGGSGSWSSDSSSIFSGNATAANQSMASITTELENLKTSLTSSGCTDFPSWPVMIEGKSFDLGDGFNQFPGIFTLLRFLFRFLGAFMGFKTISAVLGIRREE